MAARRQSELSQPPQPAKVPPPRQPLPVGIDRAGQAPAKPVGWLIGLELLRKLKAIAGYAAFGDGMDHKDWMSPSLFWFQAPGEGPPPTPVAPAMLRTIAIDEPDLWFDYIADTGDGQTAVHNVACLCLSDVDLATNDVVTLRPPGSAALPGGQRLPRGAFLFVGGDTAYHVADVPSLVERLYRPFAWACHDLQQRGWDPPDPRPLLGIPGNHDYYDALRGFNQQFREELPQLDPALPAGAGPNPPEPRLSLPGFRRLQHASYFAARLPFDWWLWALDTQEGHLDIRQRQFFKSTHATGAPPARLIVATPEPVIAMGAPAKPDSELGKAFEALALPRRFLELDGTTAAPAPAAAGQARVDVRLDLAGDLHHYERYGASAARPRYAAVVAGTGGAFLHPTHPRAGTARPDRQDPDAADSRSMLVRRLLDPINIVRGGLVWVAGMIISGAMLAGAALDDSFRRFLTWGLPWLSLDRLRPRSGALGSIADALALDPLPSLPSPGSAVATLLVLIGLVVVGFGRVGLTVRDRAHSRDRFRLVSVFAVAVAVALGALIALTSHVSPVPTAAAPGDSTRVPIAATPGYLPLLVDADVVLSVLAIPALLTWSARFRLFRADIRRGWAVTHQTAPRDWLGLVALWAGPLLALFVAMRVHLSFARLPGAALLADGLVLLVLLGVLVGLPLLGAGANGRLRLARRLLISLMGLLQALGHLAVPFLIVATGAWNAGLAWAGGYAVLAIVTLVLARRGTRLPVLALWVAWIALPLLMVLTGDPDVQPLGLGRLVLVILTGAIGSCLLLGSYLWIATLFDGHFNEAGGGARLERHRQLLRFHVTARGLEVFVLGIDVPTLPELDSDPPSGAVHLVDRFTLPAA